MTPPEDREKFAPKPSDASELFATSLEGKPGKAQTSGWPYRRSALSTRKRVQMAPQREVSIEVSVVCGQDEIA